ncbi:MAG: iron ABC transporter permease [Actinobacteria bacterium]|nr:iron ABC transporter permease [Actinomycetota bacterium]
MSELVLDRAAPPPSRPAAVRLLESIGLGRILVAALTAVVGFLVLYPVVMLLIGSFAPPRGVTGELFSLDGYRVALTDDAARTAAWTTIWLSLVRAGLAVALAIFLAWAIVRTDVPGGRIFHTLLLVHFFLPVLPQVLAWVFLLSPRTGLINVWLRDRVGIDAASGPFNVFSYEGIIFVGVLNWSAFLYLFIAPAFRAVDARLEEAARMAGASGYRTLRRISVPLLWPAILGAFGLSFVRQAESFEPELLLGVPANIYVFTTQIYAYIGQDLLPRYPPAIALSTLFIVLTTAVILLQQRVIGGRSFVTVSGKDFRTAPARLGAWKWPLFALLVLYNVLALVLPTAFLVLGSFQRSVAQFRLEAFTLEHWKLLGDPTLWTAVQNTLIVGGVAATVGIALVAVVSYVVVRTRFGLRHVLDVLTWVPYMVPSFVLGVGFLWAALRGIPMPFVLYGSLAVLMIAFVVRLMPLGSRLMNGTMVQLSPELEEASRISGATWTSTFRKIVLPLLAPALGIGWLMFMAVVIRDLSTVILLFGPRSQLMSVTFFSYWRGAALEGAAVIGLLMTVMGLVMACGIFLLQRSSRTSTRATI